MSAPVSTASAALDHFHSATMASMTTVSNDNGEHDRLPPLPPSPTPKSNGAAGRQPGWSATSDIVKGYQQSLDTVAGEELEVAARSNWARRSRTNS